MLANVKGTVYQVGEVEQVTDSFKKRLLVVYEPNERDSKYDNYHAIEFSQSRVSELDDLVEGQAVELPVEISGRKYIKDEQERFFPTLRGWKIDQRGAAPEPISEEETDDLPF